MNVEILGCVELRTRNGERVELSPAVRLLLAALAWSPNAFVADAVAAERVWENRPPAHPRDALYTLATRLRKALRSSGSPGCDVARRLGGYILIAEEQSVDVSRFRGLAAAAGRAERRGESESALSYYEAALGLWRGDPLADVGASWAEAVRMTLRHEHRAVVLHGAELALRAGQHDEYIPRLTDLVHAQCLDEKATGFLMLALYRSGLQGDALRWYRRIRSRLVEGLGVEPGAELRALHERLLRGDEAVRAELSTLVAHAS